MRWYLQRGAPPRFAGTVLVVERDDERGYCCEVASRAEARACLPWLRDLVEQIDEPFTPETFGPVEIALAHEVIAPTGESPCLASQS